MKHIFFSIIALALPLLVVAQTQTPTQPQISGNVYGGGRTASVEPKADATTAVTTATVDIYAGTIEGSVFGGNDINGHVLQAALDGSKSSLVTIHDGANVNRVHEVYGGGNGYYAYYKKDSVQASGNTFSYTFTKHEIGNGLPTGQKLMVYPFDTENPTIATHAITELTKHEKERMLPTSWNCDVVIGKANGENNVYVDSAFGGAKHARVAHVTLTVESGTVGRAFAGNNFGGKIEFLADATTGAPNAEGTAAVGSTHLTINATRPPVADATDPNSFATHVNWSGVGRTFGIGEAYGGGNAFTTPNADVTMTSGYVGRLFGGNNEAAMSVVPAFHWGDGNINIGQLYGGGNAGDMNGALLNQTLDLTRVFNPNRFNRAAFHIAPSTMVHLNKTNIKVDSVYGGCRNADIATASYVLLDGATCGVVFGGCNVAGIVGRDYPAAMDDELGASFYLRRKADAADVTIDNVTYQAGDIYHGTFDQLFAQYPSLKHETALEGGAKTETLNTENLEACGFYPHGFFPGSFVEMRSGKVLAALFAGSNGSGYYAPDNKENRSDPKSIAPYMVGTGLVIRGGQIGSDAQKAFVYGGGNYATVGRRVMLANGTLDNEHSYTNCMTFVALDNRKVGTYDAAKNQVTDGGENADADKTVMKGNVFGGGRMASVYGTCDVLVRDGVNVGTVYGGNDIAGHIEAHRRFVSLLTDPEREKSANVTDMAYAPGRCPEAERTFCDSLLSTKLVASYLRILPGATLHGLYGGGNGYYDTSTDQDGNWIVKDVGSDYVQAILSADVYRLTKNLSQTHTWLDIKGRVEGQSYGGGNNAMVETSTTYITRDAYVANAFAGGDNETVTKEARIILDCNAATEHSPLNVRGLFGGNNLADMNIVPRIDLMRGRVDHVYGGGNKGDMKAGQAFVTDATGCLNEQSTYLDAYSGNNNLAVHYKDPNRQESFHFSTANLPFFKGTNVIVNSPYPDDANGKCGLVIDRIFGGCRCANVDNSTFVRITRADYIGDIYGGCDIAGTVGDHPGTVSGMTSLTKLVMRNNHYEADTLQCDFPAGSTMANAGTYVLVTGSYVKNNIYGGGNGEYIYHHDANGGKECNVYRAGTTDFTTTPATTFNYPDVQYPWVSQALTIVMGGHVDGGIYGGGNMASVGHASHAGHEYEREGRTTVVLGGGTLLPKPLELKIDGTVYGGGRIKDVYGTVDVLVKSDVTLNTLFAGNDVAGKVYGDNRLKSGLYGKDMLDATLTYGGLHCTSAGSQMYVRVENGAKIEHLFGGSNGEYTPEQYKEMESDYGLTAGSLTLPPDLSSLLDVRGTVTEVYGGGNRSEINRTHVNITGEARVGTVYGGSNRARVWGDGTLLKRPAGMTFVSITPFVSNVTDPVGGNTYRKVMTPEVDHVYGGCNNTGDVENTTRVYMCAGTVNGNIYGGGRMATIHTGNTQVCVLGGEVKGNVYGGGLGPETTPTATPGTDPEADAGDVDHDTYVYVLNDRLVGYPDNDVVDAEAHRFLQLFDDSSVGGLNYKTEVEDAEAGYAGYVPAQAKDANGQLIYSDIKIGGNVFGGGRKGAVKGKTHVQIGSRNGQDYMDNLWQKQ